MKIWALRSNPQDKNDPTDMMQDVFLKNNICYVRGGEVDQSFKGFGHNKENFKKALMQAMPEKNAISIGHHVAMNLDFVVNMKEGDLIVVPYKRKKLYVGKVTSDYKFDADKTQDQKHSRDVQWFDKTISKAEIGAEHYNKLFSFSPRTIFEIKAEEARNILKRYFPSEIK